MDTSRSEVPHEGAIWQVSAKEFFGRPEASAAVLMLVDIFDSDPVIEAAMVCDLDRSIQKRSPPPQPDLTGLRPWLAQ